MRNIVHSYHEGGEKEKKKPFKVIEMWNVVPYVFKMET